MPPPGARLTAVGQTQRVTAVRRPILALAVSWPGLWLLAVGLEVVAGGAAAWLAGRHGPAVVAVLVNLLVALRFAVTLCPGNEPLISRYARFDNGGALPPLAERYTRALTAAWAWLLAVFAVAHGMAAWDWWTTATIATVQGATCVAVFLGEHGPRSWLLAELGRSTPLRTLRAIWLHANGHATNLDATRGDTPTPGDGPGAHAPRPHDPATATPRPAAARPVGARHAA